MCATVRRSFRRSYVKTVQSSPAECTKFGDATSTNTALTPFWCSENLNKSSLLLAFERMQRVRRGVENGVWWTLITRF